MGIQGRTSFKAFFQGFSRHLEIQGRFKAFQGFKVVVATLCMGGQILPIFVWGGQILDIFCMGGANLSKI